MSNYPCRHALGRIDVIALDDLPALSRDVPFNLPSIQTGWPDFEHGFDSLKGRRMMGLVYGTSQIYRMCSTRLDRDAGNPLGLDETVIPGGSYLRLRLRGEVPAVYEQIGEAFEVLFTCAEHDSTRPQIENYRREGEIDCLVPILA
ncbi:AraC family transcriptional regulator [Kocuria sp. KSNUG]|uniref:AraC family transcriptional regulator n=1 Tax=Kocuria sp. KSNUG TaxID=3136676 RepID=UPI003C2BC848